MRYEKCQEVAEKSVVDVTRTRVGVRVEIELFDSEISVI